MDEEFLHHAFGQCIGGFNEFVHVGNVSDLLELVVETVLDCFEHELVVYGVNEVTHHRSACARLAGQRAEFNPHGIAHTPIQELGKSLYAPDLSEHQFQVFDILQTQDGHQWVWDMLV